MNMRRLSAVSYAFILLFLVAANSSGVMAEQTPSPRISQSIENRAGATVEEHRQLLDATALQVEPGLVRFGSRKEGFEVQQRMSAHHDGYSFFRIYDAKTLLTQDDDEDGFYSRLRVTFDADVDQGDSYVYARLYVSFEGGPWNHYYTTETFHIHQDVGYDDYEVVTHLLDGYPSGYYDVLIELYEADWDGHVASIGPYEDRALSVLPLEDEGRDYGYSSSHGGGGALGLVGLVLLGFAGIACRISR